MNVAEDAVPRVGTPPHNLQHLRRALQTLRQNHDGVLFERYLDKVPRVAHGALLCRGAVLVGDVHIGERASVWFGAVLRADLNSIRVGAHSNIQDGAVVHLGDYDPTVIGEHVVVGHRAVLHGCTLEDRCLIGMQATVLDGASVGSGAIVGAGSVVAAGSVVPPNTLVAGSPAKLVRRLDGENELFVERLAAKYARLASNYRLG